MEDAYGSSSWNSWKDLVLQIENLKTVKEMWEAIKTRNLGADHVKEERLQTLITEFKNMKMLDNAFEQVLDLKTTGFEDVVGRLNAYEERVKEEDKANDSQDNFLYTRTEYSSKNNDSSGGSRCGLQACYQIQSIPSWSANPTQPILLSSIACNIPVAHTLEVVDEVKVKDVAGITRKTKVNVTPRKTVKIMNKRVPRSANRLYKAQLKVSNEGTNKVGQESDKEGNPHSSLVTVHETNPETGKGWKINHLDVKATFLNDPGELTYYLGIEVSQGKDCTEIKQERYAMKILKEAGMEDCNPVLCPMEPRLKLSKVEDEPEVEATQYQKMLSCLRYLLHTRPDITYSVGVVSRFMQSPRTSHDRAIKQILRYLKGTTSFGIKYKRDNDMRLCSQKQTTVALSSCEAEFMAATAAACQVIWLREVLAKVTKNEHVMVERVSEENQRADPLTKSLARIRFKEMRSLLVLSMSTDDWNVVSRRKLNHSSKEDDFAKISSSIFVMNFPNSFTAKDLFLTCKVYEHVVDSFIPFKKSKTGKRFGFVRFINVFSLERLVNNLCTIWVSNLKLHANGARFQRPSFKVTSSDVKNISPKNSSYDGEVKSTNVMPNKGNVGIVDKSFASVLNSNHLNSLTPHETSPAIVLDDSCLSENDYSCVAIGKIKDINVLSNLYVILNNEGFDNVKISYLCGFWVLINVNPPDSKKKLINHAGVLSWFSELGNVNNLFGSLADVDLVEDDSLPYKKICLSTKVSTIINNRIKVVVKGKVYWIRIRELEAWSPEFDDEFCESSDDDYVDEEKKSPIVHVQENPSDDPFGIYNILNKENKSLSQDIDPSHPPGFTPKDADANVEENAGISIIKPDHSVNSLNNRGISSHNGVKRSFNLKLGGSIMDVIENLVEIGQTMGYNMEGCLGNLSKKRRIQELNTNNKINFVAIQETKLESIDLFSIKELWGNLSFKFSFSPSVGYSEGILYVWDPACFVKENATISDNFVAVRGTWVSSATKLMIVSIYAPQDLTEKRAFWDYISHIIDLWDGECISLGDFNKVRSEQKRFGSNFNISGANAFNHFISSTGLIDLSLEGYLHTWAIKSAKKMSKLDRFLISEGLLLVFPSLSALCLDRHLSDHRPIIMREVAVDYRPSPFRIYHSWFNKKGFDKLVKDSWSSTNTDDSKRLFVINKLFDSGHSNEELVNERTSLLNELHNINKCLSLDMAQKVKVRWAVEGDENTKFFYGIVNMKRSQLAIRGVLIDGDWIDKPCNVKNVFFNHFANRFASPSGPSIVVDNIMFKQLTSEQVVDLECDITYDEIKRAVWDCGTNKSPGPDGFTFDFIRTFWNTINEDIVNAVWEFFNTSKFPSGCNSSFIALILKKQDVKFVKDFRSISLIGRFYKIIAKILANRLNMVISDLISDIQSAFVPNRQILDGPFILNEIISWCKSHKSKVMIFKVDFEKAFDNVRWDYLDGILSNFGFGTKWRGWIQSFLSSARGSILVNGSPTLEFQFHKGLKQGDPLSPYLFILVMESLHLSFNNILNAGIFKGIRIDDTLSLSHLFMPMMQFSLSKLMGVGVSNEEVNAAANIIGCATFSSPFTYLGVKVGMAFSRRKSWDEVIGKISAHFSKWKIKTISIGGRLTLIKSVLTSLPLYHMSLYKAPLGVLYDLETLHQKFFNGIDKNERKILFLSQDTSLWHRLITSLYGKRLPSDGNIRGSTSSPWKNITVVEKLNDAALVTSFRRVPRGGVEDDQFVQLGELVGPISLLDSKDHWTWILDSSGEFSVHSARTYIDNTLLSDVGPPTRWVKVVPNKINIFA
uniref:Putative RNA-directed DNA polymerase, eukaryota, reverse transcriptase zinc-binding domain protein n=1 Tax=Tanacetum cinerariifolium TaxID=118510 RepID=A0A6L2KUK1_TANCI|nr:putative RNA-directed DNA polymerase, eukaryota, reverse transcriptase zinc-binding domain protein [Tanacetum cinerariifolium]